MKKTSIGLDENIAGLLCYALAWVSGLVILLLETENKIVRFHALQSIITFGVLMVAGIILGWIPVIGILTSWAISVLGFILWIVLMVKSYQGVKYKLPLVGDYAEKRADL
ncbi:DUF4870 domain-containing protein [Chloroflexota bacterium]